MRIPYTYWKDESFYIGHLNEFPEYETQGRTLEELQENLLDIYKDIASEEIPYIKRIGELVLA